MLKDFDEPQPLYQLVIPGCLDGFPPPRAAEARIVSLPRETTPLIGRETELGDVAALIAEHRLVTLTGEGGSGKTRIAVRLAWRVAPKVRGSVAFASLAGLDRADQAASAIARALERDGVIAGWDDVVRTLHDDDALLVLDNAEHLDGFDRLIDQLLAGTSRLRLVITSRTPLGLEEERLYPVDPLPLGEATELLCARIRLHQPGFEPTDDEISILANIARRLDGLPLALELAAARTRSLPPHALFRRLDDQLDVLSGSHRQLPERQRTMRSAIEWSYRLLDVTDRRVFQALSVFPTPARLGAIAATAGLGDLEVLDALTRLIDASLIRLGSDRRQPRYWMLEPLRQFAAERLAEGGEQAAAQRRMLHWHHGEADQLWRAGDDLLVELRDDTTNIIRALDYAAVLGEWETGVELAQRVVLYLFVAVGTPDQLGRFAVAADREDLSPCTRAQLRLVLPLTKDEIIELPPLLEAIRWLEHCDDEQLLFFARVGIAHVSYDVDLAATRALLDAARAMPEPNPVLAGILALDEALLAAMVGSDDLVTRWEHAVALADQINNTFLSIAVLNDAAWSAVCAGDTDRAARWAEEGVDLPLRASLPGAETLARHTAAVCYLIGCDLHAAAGHLYAGLVLQHQLGRYGQQEVYAYAHAAIGLLSAVGDYESAAKLEGALRDKPLPNAADVKAMGYYEHLIDAAKRRCGDEAWVRWAQQGLSLTHEETMRLATDAVATVAIRPPGNPNENAERPAASIVPENQ